MESLKIDSDTRPDGTMILALNGAADRAGAPVLERQVTLLYAKRPPHVVLDLSKLEFISSLAMGMLVSLSRSAKGWKGRVTLAAPNQLVMSSFKHARLDALLTIVSSVEAALAPT